MNFIFLVKYFTLYLYWKYILRSSISDFAISMTVLDDSFNTRLSIKNDHPQRKMFRNFLESLIYIFILFGDLCEILKITMVINIFIQGCLFSNNAIYQESLENEK